jgi:phosphate-selective porin OprO/OprP
MEFLPGPASIKAEWMKVETQRRGESVEDTDLSPLVGEGWYVSGTYAITGEKKSNVNRPKRPLLQGGFGAVEVGARVESLRFRSGTSSEQGSRSPRADVILGNRTQVTTFGVNWYINRFFKVQANYIREKLDDPSQGPLPSKAGFATKAVRFQFSL